MRTQPLAQLIAHRRRRETLRHSSPPARWGQRLAGVGLLLAVLAGAAGLVFAAAYANLTSGLPSLLSLPALLNPRDGLLMRPTELYDRTGQTLLISLEPPGAPRRYLPIDSATTDRISPEFTRLTVALLQPDYGQSSGARFDQLTNPQPVTIAERLVDKLLLQDEPLGLRRSLRMRLLGAQLISEYGPGRVLEWYLNSVWFGRLAYGVESAARLYIGKSASQLDLGESALLLATMQAPALNPLDAPKAALENQRTLLDSLGQAGRLTFEESQQASLYEPRPALQMKSAAEPVSAAPAFTAYVLDQLYRRFGRERVEQGGLRVVTSLDVSQQRQFVCTIQAQLARLEGKTGGLPDPSQCEAARFLPSLPASIMAYPPGLRASALLMEPATGQILAYAGDSNGAGELAVSSTHQPGTTLTPFLAVAAFSRGFSPASLVWELPDRLPAAYETIMAPVNGKYTGPMRLRTALAGDKLVPLQQVLLQVGSSSVWRLAEPLGLTGLRQSADPARLIAEGGDVTLPALAEAYSVFANMGNLTGQRALAGDPLQPVAVMRVVDNQGRTLFAQDEAEQQPLLSPALAYLVHNVLSDESARWPSLGFPNALEIGRPAGAKTGLAAGGKQAWAVGYTRQRLAVTWLSLASDAPQNIRLDARASAGIWYALMQQAHRDLPALGWDTPPGISTIEVCDPSGFLPTKACPQRVSEVFLNGTEPTGADTLFRTFQVNRETGLLATVFTPPQLVEERTYLVLPPEAQAWGRQAGLPLPPSGYDRIQPPASLADVRFGEPALFSVVRGKITLRGTAGGAGFASYRLQAGAGLNPQAWLNIGQGDQPVKDGVLGTWDTQGENGLFAVRLQVIRSDNRVDTAILQVTVDNTPPTVRIASPQPGSVEPPPGGPLILLAEVSDVVGVARVEFWLDGKLAGQTAAAPYVLLWQPVSGTHTLKVIAYDQAGNKAESSPVDFSLK